MIEPDDSEQGLLDSEQGWLEPDLDGDAQWSEHSDRHLLRLYRDSLFHQTDENGAASLDFAAVVHALNKLESRLLDMEEQLWELKQEQEQKTAN